MILPMILEIHFDSYYFNHSCMVKIMLVLFKKKNMRKDYVGIYCIPAQKYKDITYKTIFMH